MEYVPFRKLILPAAFSFSSILNISIFYRYFHGHCSQEIKNIIPDPVRRVRTTRSSTYAHPFQVTLPNPRTLSHKSSFIPRTSQLWNSLPPTTSLNPTICHLLNLTSTNMILSPFLLKLSLIFSVFPLSRLCYRPYGLPPTLLTKKKKKTAMSDYFLLIERVMMTFYK